MNFKSAKFKNMSIRLKLWFAALVMMLCAVALTMLAIILPYRIYSENILCDNRYARQSVIDDGLVSVLNEVTFLHSRLVLDSDFNNIHSGTVTDFSDIVQRMGVNRDLVKQVAYIRKNDPEKTLLYDGSLIIPDEQDYIFAKRILNENRLLYEGPVKSLSDNNYLLLGKRINTPYQESTDCVIYYIDLAYITTLCTVASGDTGSTVIVSNSGITVSNPNSAVIGRDSALKISVTDRGHKTARFENKRSIIIYSPLGSIRSRFAVDWNVISAIPYDEFYSGINTMLLIFTGAGLVIMIITSFIFLKIMSVVTAPISKMSANIRNYGKDGKFEPTPLPPAGDELAELQNSYDDMLLRIKDLVERNNREMEIQRKLELDALQAQINPHFLYNTLDAIAWLAKLKKQPQIENMVISLAAFFRISLHNGDKYITVGEEIDLIKSYIGMEEIRHPDRFVVVYETDENVRDLLILKLILQPLVENAFKHGLMTRKKGRLTVSASMTEKSLLLKIKDDGPGFSVDKLGSIEHSMSRGGYGLKNIRERLKLEYGENASMLINSAPDAGTEAIIEIALDAVFKTSEKTKQAD